MIIHLVAVAVILCGSSAHGFPSWAITIVDYSSTFVTFMWDVNSSGEKLKYQVWYWPADDSSDNQKLDTFRSWVVDLVPVTLYGMWLIV